MVKKKKFRKVGLIGVCKNFDYVNIKFFEWFKKYKGKVFGSWYNVEQKKVEKVVFNINKDLCLGSKKLVLLIKLVLVKIEKCKFVILVEELVVIEVDDCLVSLLDKFDEGEKIIKEQQYYVDIIMVCYKVLCDLMGISDDEDEEDEIDDLDVFDVLKLDDYEK